MKNYLNKTTLAELWHTSIKYLTISINLRKNLQRLKYFFLVSASLAEHEVEGRSRSKRGKQRWQVARLEIKGIHRYKNRVNNEKQATASWFNDTVEIWSGLIKVELFATILQSIYWIENWIVRTNVIRCSIYFFSFHKSFTEI